MREGAIAEMVAPGTQGRPWRPGIVVLLLLGALIAAVSWARLPVPSDALRLDAVHVSLDAGPFAPVTLPHRWPTAGERGNTVAHYRLTLPRVPGEAAALLIPGARHDLSGTIDGHEMPTQRPGAGADASLGATHVLRLPPAEGTQTDILLRLERSTGYAPGYLSELHLTSLSDFEPLQWVWRLAESDFHLATRVLHGTVLLSVLLLWLWRRKEPVFGWMTLLAGASFLTDQLLLAFSAIELRLFAVVGFGLIALAFALALTGASRPYWLKLAIVLVPALLLTTVQLGLMPAVLALALSGLLALSLSLAGAVLLLLHAWRHAEWDRAAMAGFYLSTVWFGLHDFGIALGWIDGARFLSQDMRALGLLVVLLLLMRWLARSLETVDQANATLRQKLDDQKRELNQLHRKEQRRVQEAVLADERQRLMRDLHDGLSGHLVSIIAQSEAGTCDARQIEDTARLALDDLRLVINALDLEDDDLRLALSSLRERVEPQMARLQIGLDWSMADLPEVRGIKPGNSLAILRILQEALTNAIKHRSGGPIGFAASSVGPGQMCLSVTNQSATDTMPGRGHGMRNMQARAVELGGEIRFSNNGGLAHLRLIVPTDLQHR